jgi:hypothetical protein
MEEIQLMSEDFPVPILNGEETIVGVHSSGISLEEGLNTSLSRNYCANCRKKIHCYVKVNKKTKEAIVHNTCKSKDCKCKCKTHYACKQCGFVHPYGQKCNRMESMKILDPKNDKEFTKILEDWKNQREKKITNIGKIKT